MVKHVGDGPSDPRYPSVNKSGGASKAKGRKWSASTNKVPDAVFRRIKENIPIPQPKVHRYEKSPNVAVRKFVDKILDDLSSVADPMDIGSDDDELLELLGFHSEAELEAEIERLHEKEKQWDAEELELELPVLPELDFGGIQDIIVEVEPAPMQTGKPVDQAPPSATTTTKSTEKPWKFVSPLAKAQAPKHLSAKSAVDQAGKAYKTRDFKAAYLYYSRLHEANPRERFYLERIGDCLFKLGYPDKAQKVYNSLIHRRPNELRYKEKLADCFAYRGFIIQARILYGKLLKLNPSAADRYTEKIEKLKSSTFTGNKWPSLDALVRKIGLAKGGKLTESDLKFIDRLNRSIFHKQLLMWDLLMQRTEALGGKSVPKDLRIEFLRDKEGKRYKVYAGEKYPVLAHFTHLDNAKKILLKERQAADDPSVLTDEGNFWNCQYKVCASVVENNPDHPISSFYGASFGATNSRVGVGFILHVPDVHRNILHTYQEDSWTPTAVKAAAGSVAVTGQYSEEMLLQYNAFMHRFQAVATYIYAAFQETERLARISDVRQKIVALEDIFKSTTDSGLLKRLGSAFWGMISSLVPAIDSSKEDVEVIFQKIRELVDSSTITDKNTRVALAQVLKELQDIFKGSGSSTQAEKMLEEAETALRGLESSEDPLPYTAATKLTKEGSMANPLIFRYLNDMEKMAVDLLRSGKVSEKEIFEKIFHRRMAQGSGLIQEIRHMRQTVQQLYDANKGVLVKHQTEIPGIFTRIASPNEILKSTKTATYNEVGIRTHLTCKDVHAAAPGFGGLIIERKTAIVHGVLRPEVAEVLRLAQQLKWPILIT